MGIETVVSTYEKECDFLDIRCVEGHFLSIAYENEVKCGAQTIRGVGVRALVDGCWAFSSTSDISLLDDVVKTCINSAQHLGPGSAVPPECDYHKGQFTHEVKKRVKDTAISEKIEDVHHIKDMMTLPRIREVRIYYRECEGRKRIINTMGCDIEESFSQVTLDFFSVAFQNGRVEMASDRKYRPGGYELVNTVGDIPVEVSQRAQELLSATRLKEGMYPVILDSELTGVFAHEVLGHCAEADIAWERASFLQDKLNERITCEDVSVCDNPHLQDGCVFFVYDDEGVPAQNTVLVHNGVFTHFMHSAETAAVHHTTPTGNCRADTYSSRPVVRMTNTYIEPGEESLEELMEPVHDGVFLKKTFGAQVDITTGRFVFKAQEGELIEQGEPTKKVKNVLIYGTMEEFLQNIEGVGCDFALSSGTCAKADQTLIIGSGGPPLRLSQMRMGGSS